MTLKTGKTKKLPSDLLRYHRRLLRHFGPQHWWPARSPFEVILGALLTQNTSWKNVERALGNLRRAGLLTPGKLYRLTTNQLTRLLRPSGTYRQKTQLVLRFLRYLEENHGGSLQRMFRLPVWHLRADLLRLPGVGPETADSILLYAASQPTFVIDAYTRRVLGRHGLANGTASYDELQRLFENHLPRDPALYNEYHALLVAVGKRYCHSREPDCHACPLGAELADRNQPAGVRA